MKRVVRNSLLGLLLCVALTSVASDTFKYKNALKFAGLCTTTYFIFDNVTKDHIQNASTYISKGLKNIWDNYHLMIITTACTVVGPKVIHDNWKSNNGMVALGFFALGFGGWCGLAHVDALNRMQGK